MKEAPEKKMKCQLRTHEPLEAHTQVRLQADPIPAYLY